MSAIAPPPDELAPGYALTELYEKRVRNSQDLFVVVSDWHNRRGTGKTVASLRLAHALDRTDEGITTGKATLSVPEIKEAYVEQPEGSALLLDEAEAGVSKYEAGTRANKAFRQLVSMGRIEEKYVVANLPNSGQMDRDLKALADVWIIVTERGAAKCNILGYNPWGEHPTVAADHPYSWSDLPPDHQLRAVYEELTAEKRRRLRGQGGDEALLPESEVAERVDRARTETETEIRNQFIRELYAGSDMTQQDIADLDSVGLSRSRVADICRN